MMKVRTLLGFALALAACGPTPGPEPRPPSSPPSTVSDGAPHVPFEVPPPSPSVGEVPVATAPAPSQVVFDPPEEACARAARWNVRGRALADAGWVRRATRMLARADAVCPQATDGARLAQLRAASTAGDRATLERRLQSDPTTHRRLGAAWVAAATSDAGTTARLYHRPVAALVGQAKDGSAFVVAERLGERTIHHRLTVLHGATGHPTHVIEPGSYVRHAAIEGDRLLLLEERHMRIFSLATGKPVRTLSWTDERYHWARFVKGGRHVVAVGKHRFETTVRAFNADTGDAVGYVRLKERGRPGPVAIIDKDHLALAVRSKVVVLDTRTMNITRRIEVPTGEQPHGSVTALTAHPSGRLAALTEEGVVHVFGPRGLATASNIRTSVYQASLAFDAGGSRLLVAARSVPSWALVTYDLATGEAVRSRPLRGSLATVLRGGERVLTRHRQTPLELEDAAGKPVWPRVPRAAAIDAVAVSEGLVVTRTHRDDDGDQAELWAWYRDQHRRRRISGYRTNVVGLSPSGRQVAGFFAHDGAVWDVATNRIAELPERPTRSFPERLLFAGERHLLAMGEYPVIVHRAALPFDRWRRVFEAEGRGPRRKSVSVHGEVATNNDGIAKLADGTVLSAEAVSGVAFAGDGEHLAVGSRDALLWFDRSGTQLERAPLSCRFLRNVVVDNAGNTVAFRCDRQLGIFRPGQGVQLFPDPKGGYVSAASLALTPSGHLVLRREKRRVIFRRTGDGAVVARLTLLDGVPVVHAHDGRLWYEGAPEWREQAVCLVGHRAYPWSWCEDALVDDGLVEALLAPPADAVRR
ncbi:MAG: hypothetical protein AAF715_13730 [Myxococcota bacterium]